MRAATRKRKPPTTPKQRTSTPRARRGPLPDAESQRPELRDESLEFAEALFGPAPAVTSSNKPDALIETCRVAYESGERARLLLALRLCLSMRAVAPAWVINGFHLATARWFSGEADTLDEAFGVVRPKNFNRAAYLKRRKLEKQVYRAVVAAKQRGESITDELFEEIGRPLGLGKTLVKEYYTDVREFAAFYASVASEAVSAYWEEEERYNHSMYEEFLSSGHMSEGFGVMSCNEESGEVISPPPELTDAEYEWMLEQANRCMEELERQIGEDALQIAVTQRAPLPS